MCVCIDVCVCVCERERVRLEGVWALFLFFIYVNNNQKIDCVWFSINWVLFLLINTASWAQKQRFPTLRTNPRADSEKTGQKYGSENALDSWRQMWRELGDLKQTTYHKIKLLCKWNWTVPNTKLAGFTKLESITDCRLGLCFLAFKHWLKSFRWEKHLGFWFVFLRKLFQWGIYIADDDF